MYWNLKILIERRPNFGHENHAPFGLRQSFPEEEMNAKSKCWPRRTSEWSTSCWTGRLNLKRTFKVPFKFDYNRSNYFEIFLLRISGNLMRFVFQFAFKPYVRNLFADWRSSRPSFGVVDGHSGLSTQASAVIDGEWQYRRLTSDPARLIISTSWRKFIQSRRVGFLMATHCLRMIAGSCTPNVYSVNFTRSDHSVMTNGLNAQFTLINANRCLIKLFIKQL